MQSKSYLTKKKNDWFNKNDFVFFDIDPIVTFDTVVYVHQIGTIAYILLLLIPLGKSHPNNKDPYFDHSNINKRFDSLKANFYCFFFF